MNVHYCKVGREEKGYKTLLLQKGTFFLLNLHSAENSGCLFYPCLWSYGFLSYQTTTAILYKKRPIFTYLYITTREVSCRFFILHIQTNKNGVNLRVQFSSFSFFCDTARSLGFVWSSLGVSQLITM